MCAVSGTYYEVHLRILYKNFGKIQNLLNKRYSVFDEAQGPVEKRDEKQQDSIPGTNDKNFSEEIKILFLNRSLL